MGWISNRMIVAAIFTAAIVLVFVVWLGLGLVAAGILFFGFLTAFILQGYRLIPSDPPHKAVVTIFGERTDIVWREGWNFFPLFPWWYGAIAVNVTKVNQDLPPQIARTPDRSEIEIPVSITWTPGGTPPPPPAHQPLRNPLIEFLNSKGESGVRSILEDIVRERVREWAWSPKEGPQDWEEAMGAQAEASAILLRAILDYDTMPRIPGTIPTTILLKVLTQELPNAPAPVPAPEWDNIKDTDRARWEPKWDALDETLKRTRYDAVIERRKELAKVRRGNGTLLHSSLGITINRLNVGEIKPRGKVLDSADLHAKEKLERRAEQLEIRHTIKQVNRIAGELGVPPSQAIEVFQTERSKVKKDIKEIKVSVSPEAGDALAGLFGGIRRLLTGGS